MPGVLVLLGAWRLASQNGHAACGRNTSLGTSEGARGLRCMGVHVALLSLPALIRWIATLYEPRACPYIKYEMETFACRVRASAAGAAGAGAAHPAQTSRPNRGKTVGVSRIYVGFRERPTRFCLDLSVAAAVTGGSRRGRSRRGRRPTRGGTRSSRRARRRPRASRRDRPSRRGGCRRCRCSCRPGRPSCAHRVRPGRALWRRYRRD